MNNQIRLLTITSLLSLGLLSIPIEKASAASVTFSANNKQGDEAVGVDVKAVDIIGGIKFNLSVNYSTFDTTGNLLSAYINFHSYFDPAQITSVVGAYNDNWQINTDNVVGESIGNTFALGVQLGSDQASGGLVTRASFTVLGDNLDVSALYSQEFMAGLGRVGSDPISGGEGSAKQYAILPSDSDEHLPNAAVPEPLTILGVTTALGFGATFKKHLRISVRK